MSELIQNKKQKQDKLKDLIQRLHAGATVEEVQEEFDKLTIGVTATEIAEMEQALVNEGMPVSDIQRLCDVHAAVFKGSIEDIHKEDTAPVLTAGHPALTIKEENAAIQDWLDNEVKKKLKTFVANGSATNQDALIVAIKKLFTIDTHYSRKENLVFPIMENYDITAPPQVMWGVDDEIRDKIKAVIEKLEGPPAAPFQIDTAVSEMAEQISEMIFKEDEIMIPMILDKFSNDDWVLIEESSAQIGFTMIDPPARWTPVTTTEPPTAPSPVAPEAKKAASAKAKPVKTAPVKATPDVVKVDSQTQIKFDVGTLTSEEINAIMNTVPLDMTFVGADDRVKYFTQGKERVFDRSPTIIGRQVKLCHPPKSVHVVEQIVADLKSGKKDNEDFWIRMGETFAYIRYFAVRSKQGEYLGTLEVTQDIKNITELEGEKRLRK